MEDRFLSCCNNSTVEFQDSRMATASTSPTSPSRLSVADSVLSKTVLSLPTCLQRRPLRRRTSSLGFFRLQTILLASLCLLLWCSPCIAAAVTLEGTAASTSSSSYSEIIYDHSPPPLPHVRLIKRANADSTSIKSSSSVANSKSATTASSTTTGSSALPSPFDSSLGNNFTTSSCPNFFQSFLSDSTFNECIPLSLLLQTSTSFFAVEQSPVRLVQTLDASCSVNFTSCSTHMKALARQIQLSSNCGADLAAQNPTVMQAHTGLAAYDAMYHAGCLQDRSTGNYCFSNAVTNASAPTSSYIYYLALGIPLPASAQPACNTCLQNTMAVFASAATNSSQPVADVYVDAAELVDGFCGADFVNATVVDASGSNAAGSKGVTSAASSAASVRGVGAVRVGWFGGLVVAAAVAFVMG